MSDTEKFFGPYRLIKRLGAGGYGIVWRAERAMEDNDQKAGFRRQASIPVAVKMPHFGEWADPTDLEHEAEIWLQAIPHPNIQPLVDILLVGGVFGVVSEWAIEGTLAERLKAQEEQTGNVAIPVEETLLLMDGILCGLEHLHRLNILHLDLKPSNIALCHGVPRLMDFGISKVLRIDNTHHLTRHRVGTAPYMAPEQLRGKMVNGELVYEQTVQADIWACGILLYELLTGTRPYTSPYEDGIDYQIKEWGAPPPLPDTIPDYLKPVLQKALQLDRKDRYATAQEMRDALQQAVQSDRDREIDALQQQLVKIVEQNDRVRAELRDQRESTGKLSAQLSEKQQTINDRDQRIKSLETARLQAETNAKNLQSECDDLKFRLHNAEQALAGSGPQTKQELEDRENEIQNLKESNKQAEEKYNQLLQAVLTLTAGLQRLLVLKGSNQGAPDLPGIKRDFALIEARVKGVLDASGKSGGSPQTPGRKRPYPVSRDFLFGSLAIPRSVVYSIVTICLLGAGVSAGSFFQGAIQATSHAEDIHRRADRYFNQSMTSIEMGNYVGASVFARVVTELDPSRSDAFFQLSIARYMQGPDHYSSAVEACKSGISLDPSLPEKATDDVCKAKWAGEYRKRGHRLAERKRFQEAERDFRKATELTPKDVTAFSDLGELLYAQKKYKLAEIAFRSAVALAPDNVYYVNYLGVTLINQSNYTEAESCFRKAIKLNQTDSYSAAYLGKALRKQRKFKEAKESFETAIKLNPNNGDYHNDLGQLFFDQSLYREAEKEFREAIRLNPKDANSYSNLTGILLLLKRRDEALVAGKKARELGDKSDYWAYKELGIK